MPNKAKGPINVIVTTTCLSILEALELFVIMYVCTMKITWLMAVLKYIIPFGKLPNAV